MDDPKIEKVAEAIAPDRVHTVLISFWSDGIVSHCIKEEKKLDVECSSIPFKFKSREEQEQAFRYEQDRYRKEGYSVRILHDPDILGFLPSMG